MAEYLVAIGRLWKVRGNRGELLGELDSAEPGREDRLQEVTLDIKGRRAPFKIEQIWRHGGRPVFKFAGIDSISQAEAIEGAEILVPRSEQAAPEEGAYSHAELVGSRVMAAGGAEVGVVTGVEDYGGSPLLQVREAGGREILIPFVKAICTEIDMTARIIRVELPEGLLELQ